jgi:tartrate-resistant acid phosphatase type 5
MTGLNRRNFLKSAATVFGSLAFLGHDAEAAEIERRKDLVKGVAKPGTPEPLPEAEAEKDAMRFFIVGDWGWYGIKVPANYPPGEIADLAENAAGEITVAGAMGVLSSRRKPDFVLSVGDNFYPNGVKSVEDPRWDETFVKAYSSPGLQVPWYVALGNHDYRGSVQAQIDYSGKSPRWRMPARHYTYSEKTPTGVTVQFFVLDTSPFHTSLHKGGHSDVAKQDTAAQLEWLERELTGSKADWKVLVGHHPIRTGGVRRDLKETSLGEILPPIMKKHGVKIYFCGHEHDAQHVEFDGMHNFLIGNGGDTRPTGITEGTRFAESRLGFGYATVSEKSFRVNFVDPAGEVRHTAVVSR